MNIRRALLIFVSFFAFLCLSYYLFFALPDLIDVWNMIQEYGEGWQEEFFQPFIKTLYGLVVHIGFYGSVALWSFFEATGKIDGSPFTSKPRLGHETDLSEPSDFKESEKRKKTTKILKTLGIIFLLGSVGIFLWIIINLSNNPYAFEGKLSFNLFLFCGFTIIGAILWSISKKRDEANNKLKPMKGFKRAYEEKKKRELENRY